MINIHGECESRSKVEDIEDRWFNVVSEINKLENKGELVVVIGDFNKHLRNYIKGSHDKVSFGGKIILDFLATKKYVLLNALDSSRGGPFT